MTPILKGRRQVPAVSAAELAARTTALSLSLVAGGEELDHTDVEAARRVIDRASERSAISGDHTVVALAGATGSGKSSLFNALVGETVATIGARRPTTSKPTAAVWGESDASELLDWLQVDARHLVGSATTAGTGARLDGLVLLDLPDFDSRESAHRQEAERVLELADVFVWVTDPQKYADARLHDDYVAALASHGAVTLAVLNQSDRLSAQGAGQVAKDFERLLRADGIARVSVLTTSAVSGAGVEELRERLAATVAGHAATRHRLEVDVVGAARALRRGVADSERDPKKVDRTELDHALARAAGVPIVLDAVQRDYRREAFAHTGWLFGRWTRGFAADPLRRLRLNRTGGRPPIEVDIDGADVRAVLGRSSIPAPTAAALAEVDLASRRFVDSVGEGLPLPWVQAVEEAASGPDAGLADSLDRAVVATPLRARTPVWWYVVNILQWVLGITAVLGLLWLGLLWLLGFAQLPMETPTLGIIPVPLVMIAGGLLLGMLLGALSRWWARVGARHRRSVIAGRLRSAVGEVVERDVIAPVGEVLARHRETRELLVEAGA